MFFKNYWLLVNQKGETRKQSRSKRKKINIKDETFFFSNWKHMTESWKHVTFFFLDLSELCEKKHFFSNERLSTSRTR